MIRDFEVIFDELVAFFKANLNIEIAAVNSQKNDSVVLKTIPAAAYIINSLDFKNKSYDPFIVFSMQTPRPISNQFTVAKEYPVEIVIFLENAYSKDDAIWRKMLRYMTALEKTSNKAWRSLQGNEDIEIQSLEPVDLRLTDDSAPTKVFGVELTFTIS